MIESPSESTPILNPDQRAAVEHPGGPVLVVAGAGSGKTRVLTARVAELLQRGVRPEAILAFTFTNKAAQEMRGRIERSVGADARRLWVGTFHATAVRILRRESASLGLPGAFVIYDREDQESVLREVVKALDLPEAQYRLGLLASRIGDAKNALVTPEQAESAAVTPFERNVARAYAHYQALLRRNRALDFDDLIAEVVRLFLARPELAARYARRFEHVLVDEYQDTNHVQFRMVELLARAHGNLFVVGDEDQSIYGWRGADMRNVLEFERVFSGAAVLRLEQNYRSTGNILRAANAVIGNNRSRKPKTLWSERGEGALLGFALLADEAEEAAWAATRIATAAAAGQPLGGTAVLYRTNAQSRAFELALRQRGLAYRLVGSISFYQRREVKDLLAYLRLAVDPADVVSFWRVWNTPRRGLGPGVRQRVEARASREGWDPPEALRAVARSGELVRPAQQGAEAFLGLLEELRGGVERPVDELLRRVLDATDYLVYLEDGLEGEAEERRGNVEELLAAARQFSFSSPQGGVAAFLAESALLTDADRLSDGDDACTLMTAHNAKGLEFDRVIVAGLEEGVFPHASAMQDPAELEEERRLFYVALTRARDEVLLTAAAYRRRFDGAGGGAISRFVSEVPEELLKRVEERNPIRAGTSRGMRAAREWSDAPGPIHRTRGRLAATVGRSAYHESFGRGRVVAAEEEGSDVKYTVLFSGNQLRKVLGRFLHVDEDTG
jgi:DNA helicase-2/ATP-dependent DNA helicase PcrA